MKLGLGLYKDSLTEENLRFARQAGATHIVVHLVDYFKGKDPKLARGPDRHGWGETTNQGKLWSYEELTRIKEKIEAHGLTWEAIENFDPSHWHDVLLDGPEKDEQLEDLKTLVRTVGKAGIPIIGYNFSIAGVWGWSRKPVARGGAMTVTYDEREIDAALPIPNGMVWNMTYDPEAPPGYVGAVSSETLWQRLNDFLTAIVPVAEEAGVRLAAHPDDPPTESLRQAARLVNQPRKYQRLLDLAPSASNGLELCLGSLQEMTEDDLYEHLGRYARQDKVCYVHARNVRGTVPQYQEVFIDEGDLDMKRALQTLYEGGFDGVVIPDHTPEMSCAAPWHAGMAYALGYLRSTIQTIEKEAASTNEREQESVHSS